MLVLLSDNAGDRIYKASATARLRMNQRNTAVMVNMQTPYTAGKVVKSCRFKYVPATRNDMATF